MKDNDLQYESSDCIDIDRLLSILKKRKKIIFITAIIFTFVAFFISMFIISPKYTASSEILVNRKHTDQNDLQTQIQTDVQMISTYRDIIVNPIILDDVSKQLTNQNYDINEKDLKNSINILSQQNSQVFTIEVKTDNPKLSAEVANEIAKVFKKKIKKIMSVNNVSILSKAQINETPVSPNVMENTMIGLIIGILVGILLAFIENSLDKTLSDMDFITNKLKINELGIISEIPANQVKKMISHNTHSDSLSKIKSSNRKRV